MEFRSLRGMEDLLPPVSLKFERIVKVFREVVESAGFEEVILPVVEDVRLFARSVGETTDIVQKEMYVFKDKGGREIALRPEGTASAVRAYIQHGIYAKEPFTKWFYVGPMFRFERPQAGRKRQFYQAGCEVFGFSSPSADAELISVAVEILERLEVPFRLEVNSVGCKRCREDYRKALLAYLEDKRDLLCDDCRARLERNPLRVLDCKIETCKKVVSEAPLIVDFLCDDCRRHLEETLGLLKALRIEAVLNPRLVRGLDYYNKTVFECVCGALGAQNTVLAGGRYDGLAEILGGPSVPALGFALGIDRVLLLVKEEEKRRRGVFIVASPGTPFVEGLKLAKLLRSYSIRVGMDHRAGSFKSQMKSADRFGARYAIFLGEDEIKERFYSLKDLETGRQERVEGIENLLSRVSG